jgi:penicillin-binding protein 2
MSPMSDLEDRRPPLSPQLALRVAVLGGVALALFAIIFFRLWFLQVLSGDEYLVQARENRTRDVRIQAPRGEILDRNNKVLVANRYSNVVQLEPQQLPEQTLEDAAEWGQKAGERQRRPKGKRGAPVPYPPIATPDLERLYRRLGNLLGMRPETIHKRVIQKLAQLPYSAVPIRNDVPNSIRGYIRERQEQFPGVSVERVYLRQYPRDHLAAQLLGYVGEISPDELKQRRNRGVKQGTIIGKAGLEYQYDRYLRGRDGAKVLKVDANGRFVSDEPVAEREPIPGRQLRLSLDLDLQASGQEALRQIGGGLPGAFVAMNPRNGQIYAMGSYPSFDPEELFVKPISQERFNALTSESVGAPLVNRAVSGTYASGSVFKPISALAGLDKGVITPEQVQNDPGCIDIGNPPVEKCNAKKTPYGAVDLRRSLTVSSDVYYYRVGLWLYSAGGQVLQKWAKKLGLGRSTGIDLPEERRGLIPGPEWRAEMNAKERKCRKTNKGRPCYVLDIRDYNPGDNANLAVGQGEVQISPLQIATAYSAIATGGRVPRPHLGMEILDRNGRLVQTIDPGSSRKVKIEKSWQDAIMDGLRGAASSDGGTSAAVFAGWPHDRLPVYGKTGTAETHVEGVAYDQSWYAAYVPHKAKPIVVVATVERGGFGAEKAAPIVRRILAKHFDLGEKLARPAADTSIRQAAD